MYSTDEIAPSKSAPRLASGTTRYTNEVGVVTQSLNTTDIFVVVDTELAAGTVEVDFDCLPRLRRLCTPRPKVCRDLQGDLRIYQGRLLESSCLGEVRPPGVHHIQERNGVWLTMCLTITIAPDVRYVNL